LPTVSNTSPLIWLSKIGKITLLKELFGEVIIPQEVYDEAIERGLQGGFSDAFIINEAAEEGWIKTSKLAQKEVAFCQKIVKHAFEIHLGEAQAIVLAQRLNALLLIDESAGRAFAEAWGLKVKGTVYVIISALRRGLVSRVEAKDMLLTLVSKGFRIEPNLLAKLIKEMDRFQP